MPRPIWQGAISFGLVTIPVKLSLATETSAKVSFNMLCSEHRSRVNQKLYCSAGDHELKRSDTVRGYEYEKGNYALFEEDDLKELPLKSSKAIEIAGFVDDAELAGPLYYQSAYYLEPTKIGAKAYALLAKTLEKTGRVAIAKFALRERERLVSLRTLENGPLLLNTLHWPDEIRSTSELDLPQDVKPTAAELKMAESVVDSMTDSFDPGRFKDEYKEAVDRLVRAKVEGGTGIVEAPEPEAEEARGDIIDLLRATMERAKEQEKKASKQPRRKAS